MSRPSLSILTESTDSICTLTCSGNPNPRKRQSHLGAMTTKVCAGAWVHGCMRACVCVCVCVCVDLKVHAVSDSKVNTYLYHTARNFYLEKMSTSPLSGHCKQSEHKQCHTQHIHAPRSAVMTHCKVLELMQNSVIHSTHAHAHVHAYSLQSLYLGC